MGGENVDKKVAKCLLCLDGHYEPVSQGHGLLQALGHGVGSSGFKAVMCDSCGNVQTFWRKLDGY